MAETKAPRVAPRPSGLEPIGFYKLPKDLADMTDKEIEEFAAAVLAEAREKMRDDVEDHK